MTRTGGNTGDAHLPEKSDIVLIFTLEASFFAESFLKAVFRWIRWGDVGGEMNHKEKKLLFTEKLMNIYFLMKEEVRRNKYRFLSNKGINGEYISLGFFKRK